MGFGEAIKTCFSKYATRDGRAPRSEYWYFVLFVVIASLAVAIVARAAGISVVGRIIELVLLPPSLAVGVRRLHDLDRSGWWYLLSLFPVIGSITLGVGDVGRTFMIIYLFVALIISIVLTVWACTRGTLDPNRYGPDPLTGAIGTARATS